MAACCGALAIASSAWAQSPIPVFTNLWNLGSGTNSEAGLPNDLPSAGNNVRGIAINPITTNVLYASTTGGTNNGNNHVTVLNSAADGLYVGQLNASGVFGGTLNLSPVKVADDGAIYACNVVLAGGELRVYRWASEADFEATATVVAAMPSVTTRLGDWMDVRGSGLGTEIVIAGFQSGTGLMLLKPSEPTLTTWTNVFIPFPGNQALAHRGMTFDGGELAVYAKGNSTTVFRVAYDAATATSSITGTFDLDQTQTAGIDFAEINGVRLLSAIVFGLNPITNNAAHHARVYQLTGPSNAVSVLDRPLPFPNQANGNGLGMSDIQQGHLVFSEPNNGISFYAVTFVTNLPPSISAGAQPAGASVVQGFDYTLTVNPSGTAPLAFQWTLNGAALPGATTSSLALNTIQPAQAGGYRAIVSNDYGSVTSAVATVTVLPQMFTPVATQLWSLAPGSRDYLTTDNTQRGLTYDAATGRLVLVSRAPTNGVHLLDAATGADLGAMDVFQLSSAGTFPINMVAAGDDGAIYACNLLTSATEGSFVLYRWASARVYPDEDFNAFQSIIYFANPGVGRIGDTLAARGAGATTELLAGVSSGADVVLFTTPDGFFYEANVITVTNLPPDALGGFARLGLAFGPGNTFWAKSTGYRLRLVEYDRAALTARVIATYDALPGTLAPLGVDNANLVFAGIGVGQLPQNLELWSLGADGSARQMDRELFPVSNPNINATGNVAFDVAGGRFFALDTNNGLIAARYAPPLRYELVGGNLVLTWAGPARLQRASVVTGPYTDVAGATSPYAVPPGGLSFYRLAH